MNSDQNNGGVNSSNNSSNNGGGTASAVNGRATVDIQHVGNSNARANFNIGQSITGTNSMAGTQRIDDSIAPTSTASMGTEAVVTSYVRQAAESVLLDDESIKGTTLFTIDLDATLTDVADISGPFSTGSSNKLDWMYYRIVSFKLWLVSTAPLGTSSGAIQICSIMDPSNAPTSEAAENIRLVTAQTKSKIINAKTDIEYELDLPQSEFKWVKKAGVPRMESYGYVLGMVEQASVQGTFAQWTVNYQATIEWKDHTFNTGTVAANSSGDYSYVDLSSPDIVNVDGWNASKLIFPVPANAPLGALLRFSSPLSATINMTNTPGKSDSKPNPNIFVTPVRLERGKIISIDSVKYYAVNLPIRYGSTSTIDSFLWYGDYSANNKWFISGYVDASAVSYVPSPLMCNQFRDHTGFFLNKKIKNDSKPRKV